MVQVAPPMTPTTAATAWPSPTVDLAWNVQHAQPAVEQTEVHVATDGHYLYVRFDATQREPVIAVQHADDLITGGTNYGGGIAWSDDSVWVDLWPTGPAGFEYQFESNANGAHNEASSENSAFAPQWETAGTVTPTGYTVTMAIPLSVVHGAHAGEWRMQFVRYVRSTGSLNVWSYDAAQQNPDDPSRAGDVTVPIVARPPLPKPRLGVYGLGALASKSADIAGSSFGADWSVPVTQTASFFGTVHPDYSNVELDQQSISPTVFQRTFNEVRPFFTQASGEFDNFNCNVCNGFRTTLYTFGIPTPLGGYAFEGRQGQFGTGLFDAIGSGRTDGAGAFNYTSDDTHWNASVQHVVSDLNPIAAYDAGLGDQAIVDDANEGGVSWFNGKYLSSYVNYSTDSGTRVPDPSQGDWIDAGGGWGNQAFALYGAVRKIGAEFNPVDGFDSHPGIAGYATYSARVWQFSPNDFLSSAGASVFMDRYQGIAQGYGQSDNNLLFDFLTKSAYDVQVYSGSDYWRFGPVGSSTCAVTPDDCPLTPISQNGGFSLTYHSGMQNNLNNFPTHGSSATPTSIAYSTGRYGLGRLDTWFRSSTMRLGQRGTVTLSDDNTSQWLTYKGASDNVQWFEDVSYAYQVDAQSSFAVGLRREIGEPPVPNGGGDCIGECDNISIAYHLRTRNEEFYLAYGDPNTLTTVPQALFKVIFYLGGQKGT
jgi:hypothetical protein